MNIQPENMTTSEELDQHINYISAFIHNLQQYLNYISTCIYNLQQYQDMLYQKYTYLKHQEALTELAVPAVDESATNPETEAANPETEAANPETAPVPATATAAPTFNPWFQQSTEIVSDGPLVVRSSSDVVQQKDRNFLPLVTSDDLVNMFPPAEKKAFSHSLTRFPSDLYRLEQEKRIRPQYNYLKYQVHLNNAEIVLMGEITQDDPRLENDRTWNHVWNAIHEEMDERAHPDMMYKVHKIKRWFNQTVQSFTLTIYLQVELTADEKAYVGEELNRLRSST